MPKAHATRWRSLRFALTLTRSVSARRRRVSRLVARASPQELAPGVFHQTVKVALLSNESQMTRSQKTEFRMTPRRTKFVSNASVSVSGEDNKFGGLKLSAIRHLHTHHSGS